MPKAVLISIQPYWVFLIIAKMMGWNIEKEKTVEVRKNYPKANDWDKTAKIYCSKDKRSFEKIPKEYQPLMQRFLGKVIGEFVCNKIDYWQNHYRTDVMHIADMSRLSCVPIDDLLDYLGHYVDMNGVDKRLYAWHISNLVIYDKPKELRTFRVIDNEAVKECPYRERIYNNLDLTNGALLLGSYLCRDKTNWCTKCKTKQLTRPPQSWRYVEAIELYVMQNL